MRVLVTRPAAAGEKTASRLKALGHDPVMLPLFKPHHYPLNKAFSTTNPVSGLIFTSAEGVRALEGSGPIPRHVKDLPVYAVGKATARAACGAGFTEIRVSSGYGADLGALIASRTGPDEAPLLYLAGDPRSPALEEKLKAENVAYDLVEAYRMDAVDYAPSALESAVTPETVILLYSRESALRMLDLLRSLGKPLRPVCFCLSPAIAAAVPAERMKVAGIAEETTEEALLALLSPRA